MNVVSVIIPHYNGEDMLYNCINSIYKNISINNFNKENYLKLSHGKKNHIIIKMI